MLLLLLGDLSETCKKRKEKKFEREPKEQRKKRLKQKKMRERRRENKRGSKPKKGRNRAANYEAKGGQKLKKTGQRKRKQMAIIKITKQDNEQKVEEKANNKVEEGPKTRAKRGKK